MSYFKGSMTEEDFAKREVQCNCLAGLLGGVIGAALTNSLEAITVAKQTNPETNISALIKKEKFGLLTKGIFARVYYNGA